MTQSVHLYDAETTILVLRDHYPATAPTVQVKIDNLLESMNHELLQVGSWVNVIGYIRPVAVEAKGSKRSRTTFVDATMLWSAGAVKLNNYSAAVKDYQAAVSLDNA